MKRPLRDPNRRPTHPGAVLRLDVLPALGTTQDDFARRLGVSRLSVSQLLHGHRALSAAMAVRLERVLGTRAEHWLAMQQAVDLWEARQEIAAEASEEPVYQAFTQAGLAASDVIERLRARSSVAYTAPKQIEPQDVAPQGAAWTEG